MAVEKDLPNQIGEESEQSTPDVARAEQIPTDENQEESTEVESLSNDTLAESVSEEQVVNAPAQVDDQPVEPLASDETSAEATVSEENAETSSAQESSVVEEKNGDEATSSASTPDDSTDHEEEHAEEVDYGVLDYTQLLGAIAELEKGGSTPQQTDKALKGMNTRFHELYSQDRKEALDKFIEEGGEKDDFDFHPHEEAAQFEAKYKKLKEQAVQQHKDYERKKEENLKTKEQMLERLRELIDSDETNSSIQEIKKIQGDWKNVGPIPSIHNKTIWANYNALLDRFYDKRSIYFELKELDRKKNLSAKIALCEKAETLAKEEDIRAAVQKLNELHEEYKHLGPVPKDDQESLWARFKGASDEVYKRRKEYQDVLKEEFKENLVKKLAVVEELNDFTTFDSDSIKEWNQKTQELLAVQKRWEAIGLMPKENAKDVNKKFWAGFKLFFSNKSKFFKKLEGLRKENLEKKEALVKLADELKENEDFRGTAEKFKKLQRDWREIGPVPEKFKDDVYKRFKESCDYFFNKRREQGKEEEKEYVANLTQKEEVCEKLKNIKEEEGVEGIIGLQNEYAKIGFVPRHSIRDIQTKFEDAIKQAVDVVTQNMSEQDKEDVAGKVEVNMLTNSPAARKNVERKQISIRKKISQIENDIATWRNNLAFFANSKTADKLKVEFDQKIEASENELSRLKKQLRVLNSAK